MPTGSVAEKAIHISPEGADEPTGNLDPERSFEIMALLQEINNLGTTVLVVTHDQNLVEIFNKRVIAIDEGVVVSDNRVEEEELEDDFYAEDYYGEEEMTNAAE